MAINFPKLEILSSPNHQLQKENTSLAQARPVFGWLYINEKNRN
ncbi:hypothetical protein X474_17640 [Dethiosulfatarculus sandiegensis]|uniref:Uncharacterized protein n=1 Tax=Dethiosulfatarculus sandiegensis TaxID=1429043 RepID=A0A0D2JTA8_9BACT|nr:hypothetical protein X474_17640 [Dethiosulfatarculus sandiegensis]